MNASSLLPTEPLSSREVVESLYVDTLVREDMPAGTGFSMALPRGWKVERAHEGATPGPDAPIVPLVRCRAERVDAPGAEEGAEIIVWAAYLPREINGWDWLRRWMASQGHVERESRRAVTLSGVMGDALTTRRQDGVDRLHRLITVKDGDLLYLIDGRVPASRSRDHRAALEIFLLAAMRFRLLEPTGIHFAEGFEWAVLEGAARVRFLASGLWRRRPGGDAPTGGSSMLLDNLDPSGEGVVGTLAVVNGMLGGSVEEIERATLEKLRGLGFEFASEGVVEADAEAVSIRRLDASRDGAPISVSVARAAPAGVPVSIILLSPPEDAAFEAWAINRRAFEIAVNSISAAP